MAKSFASTASKNSFRRLMESPLFLRVSGRAMAYARRALVLILSENPYGRKGAGGGIRTHEPLRDEVLSLAPLTRLGDPRSGSWPHP